MAEVTSLLDFVLSPIRDAVVKKMKKHVNFIRNYEGNMDSVRGKLEDLCNKKLGVDDAVRQGKDKGEKIKREAANWLKSVEELSQMEELKNLMKDDRVAEITVKLMERRVLKTLLKEDKEILDKVVKMLKKSSNHVVGGEENKVALTEDDYKRVGEVVVQVMAETTEEFKRLMKDDMKMAIIALNLMVDEDLESLMKGDADMAEIVRNVETIIDSDHIDHTDEGEQLSLLKKHKEEWKPADKTAFKEAVKSMVSHLGRLLKDEDFLKELSEEAKFGLQVMDSLCEREGLVSDENNSKRHRCCGLCVDWTQELRRKHDLSEAAEMINEKIDMVIAKQPGESVTRPKRQDELEGISSGFVKGLQSREDLIQKLLLALTDDKLNAVGVYGMGGSGKTTLAKEVFTKARDIFGAKVIMVEISATPNIERIQVHIADALGLNLGDVHSNPQRATKIYASLKPEQSQDKKAKKNLVILDNIFQKLDLKEVGIPHDYCKLLLTSREEDVCKAMGIQESAIFQVGVLNDTEARDLFNHHIDDRVWKEEHKLLAERILSKCGGLPLTIVTSATALKGQNLQIWQKFADNLEKPISSQVTGGVLRETYSILETSYEVMDCEEKKMFFLLSCLYPVGSAIPIEELMRYGVGLGLFQHVNKLYEAMQRSSAWAYELVSSSLLLQDDSERHVKIHDVIRASAISFAEKGKQKFMVESVPRWMDEETFEKYTAISLWSGNDFSCLSGVKAHGLQILLLEGDRYSESCHSLNSDFFQGMTNLRVLALSNMDFKSGLPTSLTKLEALKTLHLHRCELGDIKMIGELVNLLVLSFCGSTLEGLPSEIWDLGKLRLLDMGGCNGKLGIPANVLSRLCHLEGFYAFDSFNDWEAVEEEATDGRITSKMASVRELVQLQHLNVVEMHIPKLEQLEVNEGHFVDLCQSKICVGEYSGSYEWGTAKSFRNSLGLCKIEVSQELRSNCLKALIKKAELLRLDYSLGFEKLVPELDEEGLNDLKYLHINSCENVKFLIDFHDDHEMTAFSKLEHLKLNRLHDLEMICEGPVQPRMFSNLRQLHLEDLSKLKYVMCFNGCETSDGTKESNNSWLPSLKVLQICNAESFRGLVSRKAGESESNELFIGQNTAPSLEILKLERIPKIERLWSSEYITSHLRNLKEINITFCHGLQSLGPPSILEGDNASLQFPSLEIVNVSDCSELESIWPGPLVAPKLKVVEVGGCDKLRWCVGGDVKQGGDAVQHLPNLERVDICNCPLLLSFSSRHIAAPKLRELDVDSCPQMERLLCTKLEGDNGIHHLPSLKTLKIKVCPKLQSVSAKPIRALKLTKLEINRHDYSKLGNEEMVSMVNQLEQKVSIIKPTD